MPPLWDIPIANVLSPVGSNVSLVVASPHPHRLKLKPSHPGLSWYQKRIELHITCEYYVVNNNQQP